MCVCVYSMHMTRMKFDLTIWPSTFPHLVFSKTIKFHVPALLFQLFNGAIPALDAILDMIALIKSY